MKALSLRLHVAASKASSSAAYTHFTLPLPAGALRSAVVEISTDHGAVPAQCWPIAWWPDESIRVLAGVAPLTAGDYAVLCSEGDATAQEEGSSLLMLQKESDGSLEVRNGDDRLTFPPDQIVGEGLDLGLRVEWSDGRKGLLQTEGGAEVLRSGRYYTQVERWVTVSTEGEYLRFRLRFDFYAGVKGVALSVMLVNDCPGVLFQKIRQIALDLREEEAIPVVHRPYCGYEYIESSFFESPAPIDIRVQGSYFYPYIANHEVLGDSHDYPHYLRPPANQVGKAVYLKGQRRLLQIEMEDFHLLRPKGIRLEAGLATLAIWPEWAEPLELQQGRRRQVRLALHWGEATPELSATQAATEELLNVYRAQLSQEVYAEAKFFDQSRVLQCRPDLYPRFEGWLQSASALKTVLDFFDFGDTPDSHYQTGYIAAGYARRIAEGPEPQIYTLSGRTAQCHQGLEQFEKIWVNNEYDVLFALGTEYLRSANRLLFQQLRYFARHTIEVDFVCYSDLPIHHRSQPAHSERHTSASAYPSHFWTEGLVQYYWLTGDDDALEVIRALADKTIWYFDHPRLGGVHSGVNREMGWSVVTLVSAYLATRDEKYDLYARKLIDAVVSEPLPGDLPTLSFGHTSLLLGCRAYLEAHDHSEMTQPVWDWYLAVVDLAIASSRCAPQARDTGALKLSYDFERAERGSLAGALPRPGVLSGFAAPDCLAYAYERTGKKDYLQAGVRALQALVDSHPGYFEKSFHHPLPEGKPFAMSYRTWITYLGAMDRGGWLKQFDYPEVTL